MSSFSVVDGTAESLEEMREREVSRDQEELEIETDE